MKKYTCKNGALIEWIDKETIRYTKNGFSVDIWTDFERGFFSRGRVLKSESIAYWNTAPSEGNVEIDSLDKVELIEAVNEYYASFKVKMRVE